MEKISQTCKNCKRKLAVAKKLLGKTVKCPGCGKSIKLGSQSDGLSEGNNPSKNDSPSTTGFLGFISLGALFLFLGIIFSEGRVSSAVVFSNILLGLVNIVSGIKKTITVIQTKKEVTTGSLLFSVALCLFLLCTAIIFLQIRRGPFSSITPIISSAQIVFAFFLVYIHFKPQVLKRQDSANGKDQSLVIALAIFTVVSIVIVGSTMALKN